MSLSTTTRALHDLGLSGWFGGTLANAVALNPAAAQAGDDRATGRVVNAGWDSWTPVNAAAIGAHLIGSVGQLVENRGRVRGQQGVATMAVVKTALTAAALGATAYSRVLGRTVSEQHDVPTSSGTNPSFQTPPKVASAQQRLKVLQWVIPALTGAIVVVSAYAGEQQRPSAVAAGAVRRLAQRVH